MRVNIIRNYEYLESYNKTLQTENSSKAKSNV